MIKFSNKSQYGLRAVIRLAVASQPLSAGQISRLEGIPAGFLEKILVELKKAGILASKRGASGGYCLAQPINQISVADIVLPLEEKMALAMCLEKGINCPYECGCLSKNVWLKLQTCLIESMKGIKLADLLEKNEKDLF